MNFLYNNLSKGFTLIELLVVISIIGVLSTIAFTSLNSARNRAKTAKAQEEIDKMYQSILRYEIDNDGSWPPGCNNIDTVAEWNGSWMSPYMPSVTADPWGTAYFFDGCPDLECSAGASSVCSAGPNGLFESHNRTDMQAISDDICVYFEPSC